jgi:hypothetical protein
LATISNRAEDRGPGGEEDVDDKKGGDKDHNNKRGGAIETNKGEEGQTRTAEAMMVSGRTN